MLSKFQPYALALLRLVTAFMFLTHGVQKAFGVLGGLPPNLPANTLMLLKTAGWIETVGSVFILLGLFTSPVAFVLCGEMAFAFFIGHFGRTGKFLPLQNGGAEAVLNCFIFLYIFTAGPGAWSVDGARKQAAKN